MSRAKDFIRGLQVLGGNKPFAGGDKNLAMASDILNNFLLTMGIGVARSKTVEATNRILESKVKKNPRIEMVGLLKIFKDTPAYMNLLKSLDMGEKDLEFLADEAIKKWGKND